MPNYNSIKDIFEPINRLFSINFSCLRLYKQRNITSGVQNFNFKQKFNVSEEWINAKLKDIISMRNAFFENLSKMSASNDQNYQIIDEHFEETKNPLLLIYNIWFEENCKFEDIFNGFICKKDNLKELILQAETQNFHTNDSAITHLINAYFDYIDALFYHMAIDSFKSIVNQLSTDIQSNGIPSMYHGIINNNLTKISNKHITNLDSKVKLYKTELEKLNRTTKNKSPLSLPPENYIALEIFKKLEFFTNQLECRLKSANTDAINSNFNKTIETFIDFMSRTKNVNLEVNEIYATHLELSYISYLTQMLDFAISQLKSNSIEPTEKFQ